MADLTDVIAKLEQQDRKLEKIEAALSVIATQAVQIANLQEQITGLWKKYDAAFNPEGTIANIQKHQAGCPKGQLPRIWWAVGILWGALLITIWKVSTP